MTIPLPSTAVPVEGRNDQGKRVTINSVGGALVNIAGTVISGPYTFSYRRNIEDKGVKKRGPIVFSDPYWQVLIDGYNLYISFVEKELNFSDSVSQAKKSK